MALEYVQTGDILYANLSGELDEYTAADVRQSLDSLISSKRFRCLVLDFRNVAFMDSTGVGIVLGRYKKLKKNGQALLIKNPNSQVYKVFKTCGLQDILDI
jgi:stage II sporulation protein AA (anti-sigma F factor antagonist)